MPGAPGVLGPPSPTILFVYFDISSVMVYGILCNLSKGLQSVRYATACIIIIIIFLYTVTWMAHFIQPWHSSVPCSDILQSEDETTAESKCLPCFPSVNSCCQQLSSSTSSVSTDLSEFCLTSSQQNVHLHSNTRQHLRKI